jgi:hypothetical protein
LQICEARGQESEPLNSKLPNLADSQPTAKKPKQAASKLAKVDTKGMGSMMSFFKPKTK